LALKPIWGVCFVQWQSGRVRQGICRSSKEAEWRKQKKAKFGQQPSHFLLHFLL
jgi:hypothetical protein